MTEQLTLSLSFFFRVVSGVSNSVPFPRYKGRGQEEGSDTGGGWRESWRESWGSEVGSLGWETEPDPDNLAKRELGESIP